MKAADGGAMREITMKAPMYTWGDARIIKLMMSAFMAGAARKA